MTSRRHSTNTPETNELITENLSSPQEAHRHAHQTVEHPVCRDPRPRTDGFVKHKDETISYDSVGYSYNELMEQHSVDESVRQSFIEDRGRASHLSECDNERPYLYVDRAAYHDTLGTCSDRPKRHIDGNTAIGSSLVLTPIKKFQAEGMKDQCWNGIDKYQPVISRNTRPWREQKRHSLTGTTVQVENPSSISLGNSICPGGVVVDEGNNF